MINLPQFAGSKLNQGQVAVGTADHERVSVRGPRRIDQIGIVKTSNDRKGPTVKRVVNQHAVPRQDAKDRAVGETGRLILLGVGRELKQDGVGSYCDRRLTEQQQPEKESIVSTTNGPFRRLIRRNYTQHHNVLYPVRARRDRVRRNDAWQRGASHRMIPTRGLPE